MISLYSDKDQPIHFFYIHFLCLLTTFYLPLFAVSTAYGAGTLQDDNLSWTAEVVSGLIVFLQAIFVIGLRLLGQVMTDPYGDDLEDLSVMRYVRGAWKTSNRILAAQSPGAVDPSTEQDFQSNIVPSLGGAWSGKKEPSTIQPPSMGVI